MNYLLVFLIVLLAALAGAGLYFARILVYPEKYTHERSIQAEVEAGRLVEAEYARLERRSFTIPSRYGYDLFAYYFPYPEARKTAVIVHGITYTLYGGVKYMDMFRSRGFNVLVYDQRNHGNSGGKNTTFGFYEKYDLQTVVDWAFEQLGPGGVVGTMGESLGAATALQHAAIDPRPAFVISDCSFSNLADLLAFRLKADYHLPPFPMLPVGNFFTRLLTGMSFEQVCPICDVAHVETPIFFAHGQNDTYILPQMSIDLFEAKKQGVRKLYLAPDAGHVQSYDHNRQEYDRLVGEFLEQVGLLAQSPEPQVESRFE